MYDRGENILTDLQMMSGCHLYGRCRVVLEVCQIRKVNMRQQDEKFPSLLRVYASDSALNATNY